MRPLIVGNWKMHGGVHQLGEIAEVAAAMHRRPDNLDVLLCVSATLISRAAHVADGRIAIGGEDCHAERSGPFTGDVSAGMLKDAGASAVIVGHSERRRGHCETNAMVAAKIQAAWNADLAAIVCVGEDTVQRDAGVALQAITRQLSASLPSAMPANARLAVAYEPVWAIGSGRVPTSADIAAVHRHIRSCLASWQTDDRQPIRILYGGSVTGANAAAILALPEVDGVLVGEASLTAHDFLAIVDAC